MNNMFARLAKQSGRSFAEVRNAWGEAKKDAKKKGYKVGGTSFIQHAFKVLKAAHQAPPVPVEPAKEAKKKSDAPKAE